MTTVKGWAGVVCVVVFATTAFTAIAQTKTHTLRWSTRGDVLTMDPDSTDESVSSNFATLIHDALVERDRSMAIVPRLAVSWKTIDDRTWRFTLRQGVRFHDGTPFTADDAVFSIQRAQQPRSAYFAIRAGRWASRSASTTTRSSSGRSGRIRCCSNTSARSR